MNISERPLDPPEDTRARVYTCKICGEEILEGDDYYDIPGLGVVCCTCIDDARQYDAELDDNSDFEYESRRDEELLR